MSDQSCSFDDPRIDASCTVNDVLLRHPETVKVFNAFGVDSCCGGAATLDDAARDSGVLPETLIFALTSVVRHGAPVSQGEDVR